MVGCARNSLKNSVLDGNIVMEPNYYPGGQGGGLLIKVFFLLFQ